MSDGILFKRVNTLISAYPEQASFLELPPAGGLPTLDQLALDQPITEKPGTQIGP